MRSGGLIAAYTVPGGDAPEYAQEYALAFDRKRPRRVLIVPPLFDELNRMRRLLAGVMRQLDRADIDSFLIDLPGTNESTAALADQDCGSWQRAVDRAAETFGASHVLGVRGGALFVPAHLPGWLYAPVAGSALLTRLARSRTIAARDAGREETVGHLLETGAREGIDLAGYRLGAAMVVELSQRTAPARSNLAMIDQQSIGGGGLWLRAEPGDAPEQVAALAGRLIAGAPA